MTTSMNDFNFLEKWRGILEEGGPRQRLVEGHPLKLYFGANATSKPIFFLITKQRPDIPLFSSVVSAERGQRSDGDWTVVLTLQDLALEAPFMGMCSELTRLSASGTDNDEALLLFYSTLRQWRKMLSTKPTSKLSTEQVRGLIAEIWFATSSLANVLTPEEVVLSWQGPFGAPQDFRLPNGNLYEIKAVHTNSRSIDISSPDQLDPIDGSPLRLALITIEETELANTGTIVSLSSVIHNFTEMVQFSATALEALEVRLATAGYDQRDQDINDKLFAATDLKIFEIHEDFPKVSRSNIPVEVQKLVYTLSTSGFIDDYVKDPINVLGGTNGFI
jgi:hypothetical protein